MNKFAKYSRKTGHIIKDVASVVKSAATATSAVIGVIVAIKKMK